jgi:hypothetical protein
VKQSPFDRSKHVYHNDAFVELVKDAVRFFNGTPVHTLPPPEKFSGTGVYALYYIGKNPLYAKYSELNRLAYNSAIYVGKAVPEGWRQGRISGNALKPSWKLFSRLSEHSRSVNAVSGISSKDFMCRFVIFENAGSDMIGTIEAALIKLNQPLWNSMLAGFGNHTPGMGRFEQRKSVWDVIHPGRSFAARCKGPSESRGAILANVKKYLDNLPVRP